MAGALAAELFGVDSDGDQGDCERVQILREQHAICDAELRELRRLTRDLLNAHRAEVRRVAVALRSRRQLNGTEIERRIAYATPRLHEVA
jgi:hypothetical protein